MRILVVQRDSGSRKLLGRLAAALPEFELLESLPGEPVTQLDGVGAVMAIGRVGRSEIERGRFGLIQTVGTGHENVDVEAATEMGVHVSHMPASETGNAESVAEHVILLMLSLSRQLGRAQAGLKESRWAQPLGFALLGKTACLVGLGDVGTALATRLLAFGMRVVATRRRPSKGGPPGVEIRPAAALPETVPQADYVILCARPNADNRFLIDGAMLARMKPGAVLINIARGELLDHEALFEALRSQRLGGAGLDVFWEEPVDPAHPIFSLDNLVATPHIAGVTDVNMTRTMQLVAENLRRFARAQVPKFLVNSVPQVRGA